MRPFRAFAAATGGRAPAAFALLAAIACVGAVASTHLLQKVANAGGLPRLALIQPDGRVLSLGAAPERPGQGIDMTVTGSISRVVIDPCHAKGR